MFKFLHFEIKTYIGSWLANRFRLALFKHKILGSMIDVRNIKIFREKKLWVSLYDGIRYSKCFCFDRIKSILIFAKIFWKFLKNFWIFLFKKKWNNWNNFGISKILLDFAKISKFSVKMSSYLAQILWLAPTISWLNDSMLLLSLTVKIIF